MELTREPRNHGNGIELKRMSVSPSAAVKGEIAGERNEELWCISDYLPTGPSKTNKDLATSSSNGQTSPSISETNIAHYTRVCISPSTNEASSGKGSEIGMMHMCLHPFII